MFDSRDTGVTLGYHGATVGGHHIFGKCINYRLTLEIHTLDFIAVVFGSGEKPGCDFKPCMESFACERKLAVKSSLIHILWFLYFFFDCLYLLEEFAQTLGIDKSAGILAHLDSR